MKCTEFRDLSELLRDGALAPDAAAAARAHLDGCTSCRAFEQECAVLVLPFRGLPPGPYLPPSGPGRLPPWATGPVLGAILAMVLVGGGAAWALIGAPPPVGIPAPPMEVADAPVPVAEPVPEPPAPPPPSIFATEGGLSLTGRVLTSTYRKPVADVALSIDGVSVGKTDAAGVFHVKGIAAAGSRTLRLEPPGGTASEALLPDLSMDQSHTLADLFVGPMETAEIFVMRHDAVPGAGVRVRACLLAPTLFPDSNPNWLPGTLGPVLPAMASVIADAKGLAAFVNLAPGKWTFQAEVDGLPFSEPVDLDLVDAIDPKATILLEETTPFSGRVIEDATGEPVAGARVEWCRAGSRSGFRDFRHRGAATTGPDGEFRFPTVPAAVLILEVRRAGIPCISGGLQVNAARVDRVDIRLTPVGEVSGSCTDSATGTPAAGVVLRLTVEPYLGGLRLYDAFQVTTGSDGRFAVKGLPGDANWQVDPQPGSSWIGKNTAEFGMQRANPPWSLEVLRAGTVEGIVLDAKGQPAPGRVVGAWTAWGPIRDHVYLVGRTIADAQGRFVLTNLRPGRMAILSPEPDAIKAPKLLADVRTAMDAAEPAPFVVEARAGGGPPVEIHARPRDVVPGNAALLDEEFLRIRGRVVDPEGNPVQGVRLYVEKNDLSYMIESYGVSFLNQLLGRTVPVAADGTFTVEMPLDPSMIQAPFRAFTLVARSTRHPATYAVARHEEGPEVVGVEVRFGPGLALEGKVLHADGTPAAGALLEAIPDPVPRLSASPMCVEGRCREDGSFRLEGLDRGLQALIIGRGPGPIHVIRGLRAGGETVEFRLPPGDGVRPVRWNFDPRTQGPAPPPRKVTIKGRIVDLEGLKAVATRIVIFDPRSPTTPVQDVKLDEAGRFALATEAGPRWTFAVEVDPGRWMYLEDAAADSMEVNLRLDPPPVGTLHGRVVTPAGAPAAGVPVHAVLLQPKSGQPGSAAGPLPLLPLHNQGWIPRDIAVPIGHLAFRSTFTRRDGTFDLGNPKGRWAVFAGLSLPSNLAPGPAVPWDWGDPRPVEVTLVPGRTLRVSPTGLERKPALVEVRLDGFLPGGADPLLAVAALPTPDGTMEFRGLPPGKVTVVVFDFDRKEAARATVEPGESGDPPVEIPAVR